MSLGWSWEQAREQLDIPRIRALQAYWRDNPPTHMLVKTYMGYKPAALNAAESEHAAPLQTGELLDLLITPDNTSDG